MPGEGPTPSPPPPGRVPGAAILPLIPALAPVTPRAALPGGEPLPLHDHVRRLLRDAGPRAHVTLVGPRGAGKTAALRHLAATLPGDGSVLLVDEDASHWAGGAVRADRLLVTVARERPREAGLVLGLAPWDTDHLIEYLLATRRDRCTSVMNRLKDAPPADLSGLPELWSVVLDAMAADGSLATPADALRHVLAARLGDNYLRQLATDFCLDRVLKSDGNASETAEPPGYFRHVDTLLARLIAHPAVQVILAAQRIVWDLPAGDAAREYLARPLPPVLAREVAALAAFRPAVMEALRAFVSAPSPATHATAATILHATRTGWRPERGPTPHLARASLPGANWPGIGLAGAALCGADLSGAALAGCDLDNAAAGAANFQGACLRGAWLRRLRAALVDLGGADLADCCADGAHLDGANLATANLAGASFRDAYLCNANLHAARLAGADFRDARLDDAALDRANLTGADLRGASLKRVDLCDAVLSGADFAGAWLHECDLQGVRLRGARFRKADLTDADLTGCSMPGADFRRAVLCKAGLADVDFEDADLRGADLSAASFHLGSTRCGLVGSPVPCEGSRTGFYTDEYEEQYYRPPEEVRKANLRGADLRGAKVTDTDFYLVDLRGARYSAEQAKHFRRCGAIL